MKLLYLPNNNYMDVYLNSVKQPEKEKPKHNPIEKKKDKKNVKEKTIEIKTIEYK